MKNIKLVFLEKLKLIKKPFQDIFNNKKRNKKKTWKKRPFH